MSQGSHVSNFKALGAPKSKWQAITHTQTDTTRTHLEFKVKVSNLKPSQKAKDLDQPKINGAVFKKVGKKKVKN